MFKQNLKAVLNTQRPDKDGKYPVRIRSTVQRKVTYYPTGIMLLKTQLVKGEVVNHPNKALLMSSIRHKIHEIEKRFIEAEVLGEDLTKVKKNQNITFADYAKKDIERNKGLWSASTVKHKTSYLAKINKFKPGLKLSVVNKDTLSELEDYCRTIGNIPNTVWSCSKYFKTVINSAVQDGTLAKNPLKGFKGVKYSDPLRQSLNASEIALFEGFANNSLNSAKLLNTCNWFLFSCYTGLRHGDLKNFVGLVNGKVMLKTEKTGEVVSIFATSKIIECKKRLKHEVFSNQKMNDYLKSIAAVLNIDKKITCHTARHTFAVQFLERGGSIYTLSKILGHSTVKTTSIYSKISNLAIDEEMKRVWG